MINPVVLVSAIEFNNKTQSAAPRTKVDQLSVTTGLPIGNADELKTADFYLFWRDGKLTLKDQTRQRGTEICVDFCSGKNKHRVQFGGSHGQPLARAINAKPNVPHTVCDATGGLGQDGFVFASLGCKVVLLERSTAVFSLLKDGIDRALLDAETKSIAMRMEVHPLDSGNLPGAWPHSQKPNTVYLDPMYPHSGKSAAVKKGMQALQRLLPPATPDSTSTLQEEQSLLEGALHTASHRVVVKRPAKADPLAMMAPVGSIKSPNTRYDIYKPVVADNT